MTKICRKFLRKFLGWSFEHGKSTQLGLDLFSKVFMNTSIQELIVALPFSCPTLPITCSSSRMYLANESRANPKYT